MSDAAIEKSEVRRIAEDIAWLVAKTAGPVMLHELKARVTGFASTTDDDQDFYDFFPFYGDDRHCLLWAGMTRAGCEALMAVLLGRVAIQLVSSHPLDQHMRHPLQVLLVPPWTANVATPWWLMRVPSSFRRALLRAAKLSGTPGFFLLRPRKVELPSDGDELRPYASSYEEQVAQHCCKAMAQ